MYNILAIVNNSVVDTWKLLWILNFNACTITKGCVNWPYCGKHFPIYIYIYASNHHIVHWVFTVNLHNVLYVNYVSIGEGNGNPLQYSCLENPMDWGSWWATVHGVAKSQIRLSDFTYVSIKLQGWKEHTHSQIILPNLIRSCFLVLLHRCFIYFNHNYEISFNVHRWWFT